MGCQRGISTEALLERVQETHGDNEHAQAYRHAVQCVTTHPEYLRRIEQGGWVVSARPGNGGAVGNTLEDLLGIEENNLPIPNAPDWELKAHL